MTRGDLSRRHSMKRKRHAHTRARQDKKRKIEHVQLSRSKWHQMTDVLHCYYSNVQTLRDYLTSSCPSLSKRRRRHVSGYADTPATCGTTSILDTVIVGSHADHIPEQGQVLAKDLEIFSQEQAGATEPSLLSQPLYSQKEVGYGPISFLILTFCPSAC